MSGFTPGPWWISKPMQNGHVQFVRAEGPGGNRAAVAKIYTYRGMDAAAADARLIAAAPDWREAAHELSALLEIAIAKRGDEGMSTTDMQRADAAQVRVMEIERALRSKHG